MTSKDHFFEDFMIKSFISCFMKDGKKSKAKKIIIKTIKHIKSNGYKDPIFIFYKAIFKVIPFFQIIKVRKSGKIFYVPVSSNYNKCHMNGIRWIAEEVKRKKKSSVKNISVLLSEELILCCKGVSGASKKRKMLHSIGESNRSLIFIRWF